MRRGRLDVLTEQPLATDDLKPLVRSQAECLDVGADAGICIPVQRMHAGRQAILPSDPTR